MKIGIKMIYHSTLNYMWKIKCRSMNITTRGLKLNDVEMENVELEIENRYEN